MQERAGDHLRAIHDLTRLIEREPENAEAWGRRGHARLGLGECAAAVEDFNRALQLQPRFAQALAYRGLAYHGLKQSALAIADYDAALAMHEDDAGLPRAARNGFAALVFTNRALARKAIGDLMGARADLDAAIERQPSLEAFIGRAELQYQAGDDGAAIRDYTAAIALSPFDGEARGGRGLAHARRGDFQAAIRDFDRAIELDGNDVVAYLNRGRTRARMGESAAALQDLDHVIAHAPSPPAFAARADVHRAAGDMTAALRDLDAAVASDPTSTSWLVLRGRVHSLAGSRDQAMRDFDAALVLAPDSTEALLERATLLLARLECHRAIEDLSHIVRLDNRHAVAYALRGKAYQMLEHKDAAHRDFAQAIMLDRSLARAIGETVVVHAQIARSEATAATKRDGRGDAPTSDL